MDESPMCMPREGNQTPKVSYYVIPFVWYFVKGKMAEVKN
jgi:hypothetical protein